MAHITGIVYDLSPAAPRTESPLLPQTRVDQYPEALAMFRACLPKKPHRFINKLRRPAERKGQKLEIQIELCWAAAGDTCGVACWNNADHTVAATVLLNGLESVEDLGRWKGPLSLRGLAIPDRAMRDIDAEAHRPLFVTLYYSRGAMRFNELTGIIPLFARSYFDLFGTPQDNEPPR